MVVEFFGLPLILKDEGRTQGFASCRTRNGAYMPKPAAIWADGWCSIRHANYDSSAYEETVAVVAEGDGLMDLAHGEVLYVIIRKTYKAPVLCKMNTITGKLKPIYCPITGEPASEYLRFGSGVSIPVSMHVINEVRES